jgi:hypothetical protein
MVRRASEFSRRYVVPVRSPGARILSTLALLARQYFVCLYHRPIEGIDARQVGSGRWVGEPFRCKRALAVEQQIGA